MKTLLQITIVLLILQSCTDKLEETNKPDPSKREDILYGFRMGMSVNEFKGNLFDKYKQNVFGLYDYTPPTLEIGGHQMIGKTHKELYSLLNPGFSHDPYWVFQPNFYNDSLYAIYMIGHPITKDSIPYFIKFINNELGITMKKIDSVEYRGFRSPELAVTILFSNIKTQLYLADTIRDYKILHLHKLNIQNIFSNEDGDHWDKYHANDFNTHLREQIIDTILTDPDYSKNYDIVQGDTSSTNAVASDSI